MSSTGCAVQQLQNPDMEYSPHNETHTHARLDKQSLLITYPCILSCVHRCSAPFLRRTCSSSVAAFVLKIMSFCALDTNASVFPACNNTQCQCKSIACHRGEWIGASHEVHMLLQTSAKLKGKTRMYANILTGPAIMESLS